QNEFSPLGQRPVHTHAQALETIHQRVEDARQEGRHIAWVRHHNLPSDALSGEPPAFVPGTWGAELSLGLGPQPGRAEEVAVQKSVFGAFSGTSLGSWRESLGCDDVLIVGFFTHMGVSTTAREALMRGLSVAVDPEGTGGFPIQHPLLGEQTAEEVRRTALL